MIIFESGKNHRLFYFSGSALNFWANIPDAVSNGKKIATFHKCSGSPRQIMNCLRTKNAKSIVESQRVKGENWTGI